MKQNLIVSQISRFSILAKSEIYDHANQNQKQMSPDELEFWAGWCAGFRAKRDSLGCVDMPGKVLVDEIGQEGFETFANQFLHGKNPYVWVFAAKNKFKKSVMLARAGASLRDYAWHTGVSVFDAPGVALANDYEAISKAVSARNLVVTDLHSEIRPGFLALFGQLIADRVEAGRFTVAVSRAAVKGSNLGAMLGLAYRDAVSDENCSVITL